MSNAKGQVRSRRRGVETLEFALVAPLLLVFILLLVQYALIVSAKVALNHACRDGVRYAAVYSSNDQWIKNHIQAVLPPTIQWTDIQNNITITPTALQARGPGVTMKITITYDMTKKRFLPAIFFGVPIFGPTTYMTSSSFVIQ